jgi:hypothetical protein
MAPPQAGKTNCRGYVLEFNHRVAALGDTTPPNVRNDFVFGITEDNYLPVLCEVYFDVVQLHSGNLAAVNVRRA